MTERFPRRRDRLVPAIVFPLAAGIGLWIATNARGETTPDGLHFLHGLGATLLLVLLAAGVWSLAAPPSALLLDDDALTFRAGGALTGERGWRVPWREIRAVAVVAEDAGDTLVVFAGRKVYRVVLAPKGSPGPILDRGGLLAALARRGRAARLPADLPPEGERFPLSEGKEARTARRLIYWQFASYPLIGFASSFRSPWPVPLLWIGPGLWLLAGTFLSRGISRTLVANDGGLLLRRGHDPNWLRLARLVARLRRKAPPPAETTVWTLAWSELDRVRLGLVRGGDARERDEGRLIEFATPVAIRRLGYESELKGVLEGRERLVPLLNARGLPIERASLAATAEDPRG